MKKKTQPPNKIGQLVTYFLERVSKREIPEHDAFGVDTITQLADTLRILGAPTRQWGRVATFVLHKANNRISHYVYTKTLESFVPHVSTRMIEKIVAHLTQYGEIQSATGVATLWLKRTLSPDEIRTMAEYHRSKKTSSESNVWKTLIRFADKDYAAVINKLIAEVRHGEENPCLY